MMSEHMMLRTIAQPNVSEPDVPGWTATIVCAGDPAAAGDQFDARLEEFLVALDHRGGSVSATTDRTYFGATFPIYTDNTIVTEVVDQALLVFYEAMVESDLPQWPVVRCDVMTFAEHDAELGQ
jgi:hypothetical protein